MLQGNIADFSLPDIFQLLALTKKSGTLRVETDTGEGHVAFDRGTVCYAVADAARVAVGVELVQAGLVSDERVLELLESERAGGASGRLSGALLQGVDVKGDTLEAFLRGWIEDAVCTLLQLPAATFRFDATASEEAAGGLTLSTEDLVAESGRRAAEWASVKELVPSVDAVLVAAPTGASVDGQVTLSAKQWQVLALLDGRRTVLDIADLTGLGELATSQLLADLVRSGLVEVVPAGGQGPLAQLLAQRERLRRIAALELDGAGAQDAPPARAAEAPPAPAPAAPEPPAPPAPATASDDHDGEAGAASAATPPAEPQDDPTKIEEETPPAASEPVAGTADATVESGVPPRRLTRDEDVNQGLLLRLIDGVKGA